MKKLAKILSILLVVGVFILISLTTFAQFGPPPPPGGSNVPIDGGALTVLFFGAALAIKKYVYSNEGDSVD